MEQMLLMQVPSTFFTNRDAMRHVINIKTGDTTIEPDAPIIPIPFSDITHEKRSEIIKARNATITGGFTYLNKTIDSDRDSVMSITGAGVAALAAKASGLPYSVTWTCADDSTIVLDADGVLGMVVSLAMFADAQHAKARPLKDAIRDAKTPEDIGRVVW
jgi:hypothetical protein